MTNLLKNSRPFLTFDGLDIYVPIPHISCEIGNNFTLEAWVKTQTNKRGQRVFFEHHAWGFGLFNSQLRFTVYKRKNYNTTSAKLGASHYCKYMKKGENEKASKTVKKNEGKK